MCVCLYVCVLAICLIQTAIAARADMYNGGAAWFFRQEVPEGADEENEDECEDEEEDQEAGGGVRGDQGV